MVYIGHSTGINWSSLIKSIKELEWINGLRAGYESIAAAQKEQYSWLAKTADCFVFTAEIDHIDPALNHFDFIGGKFHKEIRPLSVQRGDHGIRVRHAQELIDAVNQAYSSGMRCKLMLLTGTKYGTTKGGIKSAVDPGDWIVKTATGDVASGFSFELERVLTF